MYETIAKECCNYNSGKCFGGMFRVIDGELRQWLDSEKADKPCLVCKGESCNFFNSVVIPGIPDNSSLRHTLAMYETKAKIKASGYNLLCKNCGKKFRSIAKNKQYCDNCRMIVRKSNGKNRVKKHRTLKKVSM